MLRDAELRQQAAAARDNRSTTAAPAAPAAAGPASGASHVTRASPRSPAFPLSLWHPLLSPYRPQAATSYPADPPLDALVAQA